MRQPYGWRILRTVVWEELVTAILENLEFAGAFAGEDNLDAFLGITLLQRVFELLRSCHCLVIHLGDNVAGPNAFALSLAAILDFRDDHAVRLLDAELFSQFLGEG